MMPYIITPRWARFVQRVLFDARYLLLAIAGLVGILQPERTLEVIGWTLVLGSLSALVGVSTGRFHFELVPIWFIIAALAYASGVLFGSGRPTSGVLVLCLVPALAERLLHLMLVASRARGLPDRGEPNRGTS